MIGGTSLIAPLRRMAARRRFRAAYGDIGPRRASLIRWGWLIPLAFMYALYQMSMPRRRYAQRRAHASLSKIRKR